MKKYILGLVFAVMVPAAVVMASSMPVLSVSGTGDNNNVTVRVTGGDPNAPVVLFYNGTVGGNVQQTGIGSTDLNGMFIGTISTTGLGINFNTPVYVQVGGYQSQSVNWPYSSTGTATSSAGAITFFPGSPNFALGQNGTITLSGGNGSYYISSNSNPNYTTASISGNTLTVTGNQTGISNLTVCSTSGDCGVINISFGNVTTGYTTTPLTGASGSPTISQGVLNIGVGGQASVTLSGGTAPYFVFIPQGSGISTTLMGNTLYVNGGSATGMGVIQVCSANSSTFNNSFTNNGTCTPLTVNVTGQPTTTTTIPTGNVSGLPLSVPIMLGQVTQVALTGGSGTGYYLQTPSTSPVLASISGNTLTLSGSALGQTTLYVCSTGVTPCMPITVTVNPASTTTSTPTFPNTGTPGGYSFENDLSTGMMGQDVTALQNRLQDEGFFTATPTGYFGPITMEAVEAYQAAHGIPAVGIVGPETRAVLNQ